MRQIGALPLILLENGKVEVYLVTSRGGRRWIIPKGNPMRGLSACDVAALEAREERSTAARRALRGAKRAGRGAQEVAACARA